MGETNRAYDRFLSPGTNFDRLQFFSDAVLAIAVTLLVIDIAVPTIANGPSVTQAQLDPKLWNALGAEFSQFLAYGRSFAVIASDWATHHRKFAPLRRFDGRLMSMNLLLRFVLWPHIYGHHFLDERVDIGMYRYVRRHLLTVRIVFLLSVSVGFAFGAVWSLYSWITLVPNNIIVGRYEPRPMGKKRLPL